MRLTFVLGAMLACAPLTASVATPAPATAALSLAHPPVTGAAGPHARATVTLRRLGERSDARFSGLLTIPGGRTLALAGPDEPSDFFLFDVTAVMFTPLERGGRNGVVVLYNSSQIGPGHGTDHLALVYRVGRDAARRVPAIERRLEGAASAAEVRRRLRRMR